MFKLKSNRAIYLILTFFLLLSNASFAQKKGRPILSWKPIKGVYYYIVEIKDEKGKIILKETVHTNSYNTKLQQGEYTIRITGYDKSGKQFGESKWSNLILKKALKPIIIKVVSPKITTKMKYARIEIKGKNFIKTTRLFLSKNNKYFAVEKIKITKDQIKFTISPKDMDPGKYDLVLINPGGKKTKNEEVIEIEKEQFLTNKEKTKKKLSNEKKSGLLGANGLYIGLGYHYGFIMPEWDTILENSYLGVNIILFYDLGGFKKISKIKVLKNFGFGFKGSYAFYPELGKSNITDSKLRVGMATAGVHYKYNFSLPIYFIFRFSVGITFTTLKKERNNEIENISSNDLAIDAEFSVLYKFKQNYFFEIGLDYLNSFFAEKDFRSLGPVFRIGFIF